jgi:hypothetical protein
MLGMALLADTLLSPCRLMERRPDDHIPGAARRHDLPLQVGCPHSAAASLCDATGRIHWVLYA